MALTPKQLTAWIAAAAPILGVLGYGGYTQVDAALTTAGKAYVTHAEATAGHLSLSIKMLEAELRYMEARELTRNEELYYSQLLEVKRDMETERNAALGLP